MARTKASVGAKISSGKSSKARCSAALPASSSGSSGSGDRGSRSYSGGNPVCQRETPNWQKPITSFFINKEVSNQDVNVESDSENEPTATSSKSRPKRNVIASDDEDVSDEEKPKNTVLDETIELEALNGDSCHKINEYYSNDKENELKENGNVLNENNEKSKEVTGKGKGVGKKTNKENINTDRRKSVKRDLEEITFGEEPEHINKKVKVVSD